MEDSQGGQTAPSAGRIRTREELQAISIDSLPLKRVLQLAILAKVTAELLSGTRLRQTANEWAFITEVNHILDAAEKG